MPGLGLVIDALAEDSANVELDINDGDTYAVVGEPGFPPPELRQQWASSVDTEGSLLAGSTPDNRKITIPLRVHGGTPDGYDAAVAKLQQKAGKIVREGGTLRVTMPSGRVVTFDLLDAQASFKIDSRLLRTSRGEGTLEFTAKPYGRGPVQTFASHTESSLPALIFTETGVQGDVPALGKLTITEAQGAAQSFVLWGQQSRYYSSAATAALFYEAESRTPLNGAATAAVTGASGGSTVKSSSLSPVYQAVLSTQASGAGAHLTHVGDFNIWARVWVPSSSPTNVGSISVAFEWSISDFRTSTRNDATSSRFDSWNGSFRMIYLGQVNIPAGTPRWEGRVIARSDTTGDAINVDCLYIVPVAERSGVATALFPNDTPTSFAARDEFDQAAGTLNGKTAPIGGAWVADVDLAVDSTGHTVARTGSNGGIAEYGISGAAAMTAQVVQVDVKASTDSSGFYLWPQGFFGLAARYASSSANVMVGLTGAGVLLTKNGGTLSSAFSYNAYYRWSSQTWYTIRLYIGADGRWAFWIALQGQTLGEPVATGQDPDLATGGALASGQVGIVDIHNGGGGGVTRYWDNFAAWVPTSDAAMFASRKLEIRDSSVVRQDSAGVDWQPLTKYQGDYLKVPPAGQEGRSVRYIVKAVRNDPATAADPAIDDITAALTVTPRYLVLPE